MPSALLARVAPALAAGFALLAALPAPVHAEASVITLTPASVATGRNAVALSMPVQRSGDLSYKALLHYATQNGTAQAGVDFDGASDLLQFLASETDHNILLNILPHPTAGGDNAFQLRIDSTVGVGAAPQFSASPTVLATQAIADFAVADFNGDGKPDVAAVGDKLAMFINTTPAGAASATYTVQLGLSLLYNPCCVISADFNADHRPDLAVLDAAGNITVLLNTTAPGTATATFSAQPALLAGAVAIAAADLDGDGRPELVAASNLGNAVEIFPNLPTGFDVSAMLAYGVGAPQNQVLLTDINGDGAVDIVVSQKPQNLIGVLTSTATPGVIDFNAVQLFNSGASPAYLAQADLDGNGRPELIVANAGGAGAISVLFNTTAPGSSTVTVSGSYFLANGIPDALTLADLNGDGHADMVEMLNGAPRPYVRLGQTSTTATAADFTGTVPIVPTGWGTHRVAVSDVNGDGLPDLIGLNANSNGIAVAMQTTPTTAAPDFGFTGQTAVPAGYAARSIAVADFNLDGRIDMASANYNSNTVSVLLNTMAPGAATPQFASATDLPGGGDPSVVVAGDINGDGRPDLVHASIGALWVHLNTTAPGDTTPTFAPELNLTAANPTALALADVNGDGKLDVVASLDDPANGVRVFLNTTAIGSTTASFSAPYSFATDARPNALAVSDLNGDGKPDLMATSFTGNTVSILLNTTPLGAMTPTFAAKQTLATGNIPTAVASVDVNGDGRPDLLVINSDSHPAALMTWINTTPLLSGTATFGTPQSFPISLPSSAALITADIDGDGRSDAIVANYASQHIAVLRNITTPGAATASFATQRTFGTPSSATCVATGDFNGDGKADLAAGNVSIDKVSVFLNTQFRVTADGNPATVTLLNDFLFGSGFE